MDDNMNELEAEVRKLTANKPKPITKSKRQAASQKQPEPKPVFAGKRKNHTVYMNEQLMKQFRQTWKRVNKNLDVDEELEKADFWEMIVKYGLSHVPSVLKQNNIDVDLKK